MVEVVEIVEILYRILESSLAMDHNGLWDPEDPVLPLCAVIKVITIELMLRQAFTSKMPKF